MTVWYGPVLEKLRASDLFTEIKLVGAKIRASINGTLFLDIHYDPTTGSYSYALIDLTLSFPGDKRVLGWDDYPHEGVEALQKLPSYPHHFQSRSPNGNWHFEASPMRGNVDQEIDLVLNTIKKRILF